MGISGWEVGQEVIIQDTNRAPSATVWRSKVTKIGRKLVTTESGTEFDTSKDPPLSKTSVGRGARLYSLESWAERRWRAEVRAEVTRLFERDYDAAQVPLETMLGLSEVLLLGIPEHLKPKPEDRLDEIRNVDSSDDHHRASGAK